MEMEDQRYHYPELTPDSVVMDLGGYEGAFTPRIHETYGCRVYVDEPIPRYADALVERFKAALTVTVCRFGLDAVSRTATISVRNDSSSVHRGGSDEHEAVPLQDLAEEMKA